MWRIKRTYGAAQNPDETTDVGHDVEPDSDGSIDNGTDESTNDVEEVTTNEAANTNTQPKTRKRKPALPIPTDAINTERKTIDLRKLEPNTVYTVNFSKL